MQTIAQVMSSDVRVVSPADTIQQAARLMGELDVGVLPVCDGQRLVGMVTDRDIAVRAVAVGLAPDQTEVAEVMTDEVAWCFEDQTVDEVLRDMGGSQLRRLPVVSRDKRLVGIVSLGDLATAAGDDAVARAHYSQIVTEAREQGFGPGWELGLAGLGLLALKRGELALAIRKGEVTVLEPEALAAAEKPKDQA